MEAEGYIKRTSIKHRGRNMSKLELTNKGWEAYNKIRRFDSIPKVFQVLTNEERKMLSSILKKLRNEALKQLGVRTKLPYPPF